MLLPRAVPCVFLMPASLRRIIYIAVDTIKLLIRTHSALHTCDSASIVRAAGPRPRLL